MWLKHSEHWQVAVARAEASVCKCTDPLLKSYWIGRLSGLHQPDLTNIRDHARELDLDVCGFSKGYRAGLREAKILRNRERVGVLLGLNQGFELA